MAFLGISEVPSGKTGDVGVVALCSNQIALLMFDY